jgi:hypothetical protein
MDEGPDELAADDSVTEDSSSSSSYHPWGIFFTIGNQAKFLFNFDEFLSLHFLSHFFFFKGTRKSV